MADATTQTPQVTVCVLTYNHEPYVAQCLESILSQQTSFGFEVIVRDDASTDGTACVLQEFARRNPHKLRLILEPRNTYADPSCKPVFGRVFAPIARGRYLATCEGDDYWTDPSKLQRQFDYMEAHSSCVMCSHATRVVRSDGMPTSTLLSFGREDKDVTCDDVLANWFAAKSFGIASLHPSSCFTRREAELAYSQGWGIQTTAGDFVRACYFAHNGGVHFMARPMSAYRYLSANSWTATAEDDPRTLARHYAEHLEVARRIDELTDGAYHDAAMLGCKQRALLLAGMRGGMAFFRSDLGAPIAPYLSWADRVTLVALRVINACGLRPARSTATGRVSLRRLR